MLLGTAFINRNITSMNPTHGVVVPMRSCPVTSKTQPDATLQVDTVECPENQVNQEQVPLPCSVVTEKKILRVLKASALVGTSERCLQLMSTHDEVTQKRLALVA